MTEKSEARKLAEKVAKQAEDRKWKRIKLQLTLIAQKYNRDFPIPKEK